MARRWLVVQFLMVCVALSHALQAILLAWRPKFVVATAGGILYSICAIGLFRRAGWALYIAVCGPILGPATLSTGALLMAFGLVQVPFRQDVYTLIGAAFQVPALIIAIQLLRMHRP